MLLLAVEYISLLKRRDYDLENEINELRREIDAIKRERTR
jgi:cell division protein FtsL